MGLSGTLHLYMFICLGICPNQRGSISSGTHVKDTFWWCWTNLKKIISQCNFKTVCMCVPESKTKCLAKQSTQSRAEILNFNHNEVLKWQSQKSLSSAQFCCWPNVSWINLFKAWEMFPFGMPVKLGRWLNWLNSKYLVLWTQLQC